MIALEPLFYKNKKAIGVTSINERIVRCTQITNKRGILIGISVDKIHGIVAEKNKMDDTEITAVTNFVTIGASATSKAGRNISAISTAAALAAKSGSGICSRSVNG